MKTKSKVAGGNDSASPSQIYRRLRRLAALLSIWRVFGIFALEWSHPVHSLCRHLTSDGGWMVNGTYGPHPKLHSPDEKVISVRHDCLRPLWSDGRPTIVYLVETDKGRTMLRESWQLSRIHPDKRFVQLAGSLRRRALNGRPS